MSDKPDALLTPETVQQHLAAHISYAKLADLAAEIERDRNRLRAQLAGVVEQTRRETIDEILRGLASENDSTQLRAIIASIRALSPVAVKGEAVAKGAEYQEHHFQGSHDVGIAWNGNRLWVCLDGQSLFRAKMHGDHLFTEFYPPDFAAAPQDAQADAALLEAVEIAARMIRGDPIENAMTCEAGPTLGELLHAAIDAARAGKQERTR